jgi:hypothetical protein
VCRGNSKTSKSRTWIKRICELNESRSLKCEYQIADACEMGQNAKGDLEWIDEFVDSRRSEVIVEPTRELVKEIYEGLTRVATRRAQDRTVRAEGNRPAQGARTDSSPADLALLQFGERLRVDLKHITVEKWAAEARKWRDEMGHYFEHHTLVVIDNRNQITNAMRADRFKMHGVGEEGEDSILRPYE